MRHCLCVLCVLCGFLSVSRGLAGQVADLGRDGVGLVVEAEPEVVDVGRDVEVTVRATAPAGRKVLLRLRRILLQVLLRNR